MIHKQFFFIVKQNSFNNKYKILKKFSQLQNKSIGILSL